MGAYLDEINDTNLFNGLGKIVAKSLIETEVAEIEIDVTKFGGNLDEANKRIFTALYGDKAVFDSTKHKYLETIDGTTKLDVGEDSAIIDYIETYAGEYKNMFISLSAVKDLVEENKK